MKLQVVPARTGTAWVRQGIKTFWRQPLALSGMFFLFMGLISLTSYLSYVGTLLGLMMLPIITLGLMAGAREADLGAFSYARTMLIIGFQTRCRPIAKQNGTAWDGRFTHCCFVLYWCLSSYV
jgi:hypothetical protein